MKETKSDKEKDKDKDKEGQEGSGLKTAGPDGEITAGFYPSQMKNKNEKPICRSS